jgi:hypothetical protein
MARFKFNDKTGQKFGRLEVKSIAEGIYSRVHYLCQCDCGTQKVICGGKLGGKYGIQSCGCLAREISSKKAFVDLTQKRFGKWVVQWPVGRKRGTFYWLCVCDCGSLGIIRGASLGKTSSNCGCVKERNRLKAVTTHGYSSLESPTYKSWCAMKERALNRYGDHPTYVDVDVCERWRKFENFLADMGERPEGTTLGRFGDVGNYEPGNCKWMTWAEQLANRRIEATWITRRARYGNSGMRPRVVPAMVAA